MPPRFSAAGTPGRPAQQQRVEQRDQRRALAAGGDVARRAGPRRPAARCARRSRPAGRPAACRARAPPSTQWKRVWPCEAIRSRGAEARDRRAPRAPRTPARSGCRAGRPSPAWSAPAAARPRSRRAGRPAYGALSEPSGRRRSASPRARCRRPPRRSRRTRCPDISPDDPRTRVFAERAAQVPVGRVEPLARLVGASTPARSITIATFASSPASSSAAAACVARRARGLLDDPRRAVAQLLVGHADVDHQVAVGLAEPDHRQRREHVQHELLRRAGLQPRRAGDELGADEHLDRVLDRRAELASRRCRRGRP